MEQSIPLTENEEYNPLADARIITPCNVCIFADYPDGKTQVGCKAGMLERLKENGAEIIDGCDTTREFFIIKDRVCLTRRVKGWQDKVGEKKTIDELLAIARQEIEKETTAEAIIYVESNNKEALYTTLDSIYAEKVLPNRLAFVLSPKVKIGSAIVDIKMYKHTLPWTIEAIVDTDCDARRSLDIFIGAKCIYPYYITFESGKVIKPGIFAEIKTRLIDKMERFMHCPGDFDGIHNEIVNTAIHKFLHGNTELPIGLKIEGLNNENA